MKGIGGHQSANMIKDEWLTPPSLIHSLGKFDLDPCAPIVRPWPTAEHHFTIQDNGLDQSWWGRVWMNPPYGSALRLWLMKMAQHANGIALTFARTETVAFQRYIFPVADSIFFLEGRLRFHHVSGKPGSGTGGAPSVLIAYGEHNVQAIEDSGLKGKHLMINAQPVIIVGVSPTWKSVIQIAISRAGGEAVLQAVYDMVELIAPDKVRNNSFYREKVRQILQLHFTRKSKGVYSL